MNVMTTIGNTDWTSIDTKIEHEGKKIILPKDPSEMGYDDAIAAIERIKADEAQQFDVSEIVKGAPWDAAVAIYRAMQDIYGVVSAVSLQSFFGPILPDMLTVRTGFRPDDQIQIPVGHMVVPGFSEKICVGLHLQGAFLSGKVRKRERTRLVEIANRAREIMRTDSIYKGKAIKLKVDDDGDLMIREQPEFIDLTGVKPEDAIHTAETASLIDVNIYSPLRNTAACRRHKIPLKRGILLEGKYGTGKSLTARVTAKVATDNGWTFVMLDRSQGLKTAIEFCQTYQPCVIFAEDIDRAADREEENVNDLVNLIDGVISKTMEIMVVLTTNFIEKIDRALLRPGRFDAVISIQPPDAETVERLIRAYSRDLLAADVGLARVGEILAGQIPATVREVVERAKLAMLAEDRDHLTEGDLAISALGMKRHLELLDPKPTDETPQKRLWDAFSELVKKSVEIGDEDVDFDSIENAARIGAMESQESNARLRKIQGITEASGNTLLDVQNKTNALLNKVDASAVGLKKVYDKIA